MEDSGSLPEVKDGSVEDSDSQSDIVEVPVEDSGSLPEVKDGAVEDSDSQSDIVEVPVEDSGSLPEVKDGAMEDSDSQSDIVEVPVEDNSVSDVEDGAMEDSGSQPDVEDGAMEDSGSQPGVEDGAVEGSSSLPNLEDVVKEENGSKQESVETPADEGSTPEKGTEVEPRNAKELDIGISEYLGNHAGFFGILKQRYSDFVVNEVTSWGKVVQLTDQSVPDAPEIIEEMPDELPPELTSKVIHQLDDLFGVPRPARIPTEQPSAESDDTVENGKKTPGAAIIAGPNELHIDVNGVTKEGRTRIHRAVKALYTTVVSFFKENEDGNKYIVIQSKKGSGGVTHIPKRSSWPKAQMYSTFVLYKENIDTMDAINNLATKIGLKPNMFAYAGTKDRRGKTSQLVSVPKIPPKKLCHAARNRPFHLGNFRFLHSPQKLGQLRGNKFQIVLREVKDDDEVIMSSIESLKQNGYINYFGSQRFGTTSIATHSIGRELLKGNWEEAVNLILAPRENDDLSLNECRVIWSKTHNAKEALYALEGNWDASIEGKLLTKLRDTTKNDLVGALGSIPRNMRVLYLHAYQSYLWNQIVSRRLKKYGLTVLAGDIVRRKKDQECEEQEDEEAAGETDDNNPSDPEKKTENEKSKNDDDNPSDPEKKPEKEKSKIDMTNFLILSEEEAKTAKITDVLLPLPGHKIEYPHNEIKDWYVELLEADGLSVAALQHRVKSYSVAGSYRRLLVQPSDITGVITYYDDPMKPLIQSDMDILQSISVKENLLKEGKHKAVIIGVTLPVSSYATMALRELLKMDTSSAFQATLNTSYPSANPRTSPGKGSHGRGNFRRDGGKTDFHGRDSRGRPFRGRGGVREDRGRGFRGDRGDRGHGFRGDRGDRGHRGHGFRGDRGDRGHGFRGGRSQRFRGDRNQRFHGDRSRGFHGSKGQGFRGNRNQGYQDESQGYHANRNQGYQGDVNQGYQGAGSQGAQGDVNQGFQGAGSQGYQGDVNQGYQGDVNQGYQGAGSQGFQGAGSQETQGDGSRWIQGDVSHGFQGDVAHGFQGRGQGEKRPWRGDSWTGDEKKAKFEEIWSEKKRNVRY